jgi:Pilus assembly protein, PilO
VGRRRELIVLLVIAMLVTAGLWFTLIRPKGSQAAAAKADEAAAVTEAESLRGQIAALEQARAGAGRLRARAREARDLFPGKPDLPDLTNALQKVADQAGVNLLSIQPTPPAASPATPGLAAVATTVTVGGGFFEIEDFLARLENLVKSPDPTSRIPPRSVLVRSVSLASGGAEGGGGTGTSGGATTGTAAAGSGALSANISLVVFQHAEAKTAGGAAAAGGSTPSTTAPATSAPTATTTAPATSQGVR